MPVASWRRRVRQPFTVDRRRQKYYDVPTSGISFPWHPERRRDIVSDGVSPSDRGKHHFITRRRLLAAVGGSVLAAACGGAYAWRVEPHWVEVTHHTMPIARLPSAWEGRTLAHITDLHAGPIVDQDYLRHACRQVATLRADLIVITGDMMTYRGPADIDAVIEALAELGAPPLGIVATLGNHDYGHGWRQHDVADTISRRMQAIGVTVLRNAAIDIDGLQIAGMDEVWAHRFDPVATLGQLAPDRAAIALSHNPDTLDEAGWGDYRGWVLCGHTHGGQVNIPLIGPPLLPVQNKRYTSGRIDLDDGRTAYINRGLGYLRRVRFNARPEIALFAPTVRKT